MKTKIKRKDKKNPFLNKDPDEKSGLVQLTNLRSPNGSSKLSFTKIIMLSAGRGPVECQWVVAQVLKLFLEEVTNFGISYEILNRESGAINTSIKTVILHLKGNKIDSFLSNWIGTIQWIGSSTIRKHHKRKNWFIALFAFDKNATIELKEKDISFQTMRSTGAGGQHVNKVNSAVRASHLATGIQVVARESRSQHQNKKIAIKRLEVKVQNANLFVLQKEIEEQWTSSLRLERGNPIRVFKGSDFKKKKIVKSFKKKRLQMKNQLKNIKNLE